MIVMPPKYQAKVSLEAGPTQPGPHAEDRDGDVTQSAIPSGLSNSIVHGSNEFSLDLSGWTAGRVKDVYRPVLNCSYFAEALIDGRPSPVSASLMPGQRLEFLQRFGFKSGGRVSRTILEARGLLTAYPEVVQIVSEAFGRTLTIEERDVAAVVLQFCAEKFGNPTQEAVPVLEEVVKQLSRLIPNLKDDRITNISLNDSERTIIEVIGNANRRLTTMQVLKAMVMSDNPIAESTVKSLLANLVRRGLLRNCRNCAPQGYALPYFRHDCGLDSGRTD
jgi:hypothetical protein